MFSVTTKARRHLLLVLFVHFDYIVFFPFQPRTKSLLLKLKVFSDLKSFSPLSQNRYLDLTQQTNHGN